MPRQIYAVRPEGPPKERPAQPGARSPSPAHPGAAERQGRRRAQGRPVGTAGQGPRAGGGRDERGSRAAARCKARRGTGWRRAAARCTGMRCDSILPLLPPARARLSPLPRPCARRRPRARAPLDGACRGTAVENGASMRPDVRRPPVRGAGRTPCSGQSRAAAGRSPPCRHVRRGPRPASKPSRRGRRGRPECRERRAVARADRASAAAKTGPVRIPARRGVGGRGGRSGKYGRGAGRGGARRRAPPRRDLDRHQGAGAAARQARFAGERRLDPPPLCGGGGGRGAGGRPRAVRAAARHCAAAVATAQAPRRGRLGSLEAQLLNSAAWTTAACGSGGRPSHGGARRRVPHGAGETAGGGGRPMADSAAGTITLAESHANDRAAVDKKRRILNGLPIAAVLRRTDEWARASVSTKSPDARYFGSASISDACNAAATRKDGPIVDRLVLDALARKLPRLRQAS